MAILGCGWSWIGKAKRKYLDVVGASGWSLIDEGNERGNIWLWLELVAWSSINKGNER